MRFNTQPLTGALDVKAAQVNKSSPGKPPRPKPDPDTVVDAALRLLARRALSVAELRCKLEQRGFDAAARDHAQARLEDFGYLNDQSLADQIAQQAQRCGRGPLWVRRTLQRRRINPTVIQNRVTGDDPMPERSNIEVAGRLVQRRFADLHDIKVKQRAMRFLCNRGFAPPVAWAIVSRAAVCQGVP